MSFFFFFWRRYGERKKTKKESTHVVESRVDPTGARGPRGVLGLVARDLDAHGVGVADEAPAGVVVSDKGGVAVCV